MTVTHQAPLSMRFPRQEYWCELPFPSPGNLPDPGIEPVSPALTGRFFTTEPPGKPLALSMSQLMSHLFLASASIWHRSLEGPERQILSYWDCLSRVPFSPSCLSFAAFVSSSVKHSAWILACNSPFYIFMTVLGLLCWAGFSIVAVCRLLVAVASLVA